MSNKAWMMNGFPVLMDSGLGMLSDECCCEVFTCADTEPIDISDNVVRHYTITWSCSGSRSYSSERYSMLHLGPDNVCNLDPSESYQQTLKTVLNITSTGQVVIEFDFDPATNTGTVTSVTGQVVQKGHYKDEIIRTGKDALTRVYKEVTFTTTYTPRNVSATLQTQLIGGVNHSTGWSASWGWNSPTYTGESVEYVGEGYTECLEWGQGDCIFWNPDDPEECREYEYICVNELEADENGYITRPYTGEYDSYLPIDIECAHSECSAVSDGGASGVWGAEPTHLTFDSTVYLYAGYGPPCIGSTQPAQTAEYAFHGKHDEASPEPAENCASYSDTYGSNPDAYQPPVYNTWTELGIVEPSSSEYNFYWTENHDTITTSLEARIS